MASTLQNVPEPLSTVTATPADLWVMPTPKAFKQRIVSSALRVPWSGQPYLAPTA